MLSDLKCPRCSGWNYGLTGAGIFRCSDCQYPEPVKHREPAQPPRPVPQRKLEELEAMVRYLEGKLNKHLDNKSKENDAKKYNREDITDRIFS